MKPTSCPRSYEVEALRDGRLTGVARENFERHLGLCRDCAREAEALQALALPLRLASVDESSVDELHVRRERTRLLAVFDRSRMTTPERPSRRSFAPALAVAFALVAVVFAGFYFGRTEPKALDARASVKTQGPAVWSRHLDSSTERVILDSGTLEIQVRPTPEKRRFVVVLPDGELEDIGTTFTVVVRDGRTARVTVREGSVLLRLRDRSAIAIGAGEVWSDASAPASAPALRAAPASESAPNASQSGPSADEPAPSTSPRATASAGERSLPRAPSAPSTAPLEGPALDFRAATALLGSGDNVAAAAAFAGFLGKYPRDARGEDASYLRIIALQRAGDSGGTERAAAEYLRRYPKGFRRAEVEKLAPESPRQPE